jgi:hypothetical protein
VQVGDGAIGQCEFGVGHFETVIETVIETVFVRASVRISDCAIVAVNMIISTKTND